MDSTGSDSVGTEASTDTSTDTSTDVSTAPSALERANAMRASLGARRDVEAMLAEASQLRQNAAADADAIVEEAQQISQALLAEGKQQADQVTSESRERADGILARARAEAAELTEQSRAAAEKVRLDSERFADDHREKVRAEVAEQGRRELVQIRQQSHALIGEAETAVQGLGANLESATATIAQVLATLGQLRSSAVDPLPAPTADDAARFDAGVPAGDAPAGSFFADAPALTPSADAEPVAEPDAEPVAEPVQDPADYAATPSAFPAVAAQAPAFDVPETRTEAAEVPQAVVPETARPALAEVPEPSIAAFMEPAEVPRAVVPEPSIASFAEVPVAEVPVAEVPVAEVSRAEVPRASFDEVDGPATREVAAVPPARLEADSTSIFAAARDELESDRSRTREGAAEIAGDLRDEGPAHRPADGRVVEETLEVMPDAEKRATEREVEPASRPLGWLFRSAQ